MKKKNNIIVTIFLIYIIAIIYFAVTTPHDSSLVDVVSFSERMKNADYMDFFLLLHCFLLFFTEYIISS